MIYLSGIDFTKEPHLFDHLYNLESKEREEYALKLFKASKTPLNLLITCDRAEVYSEREIPSETIERVLSLNPLKAKIYRYSDEDPIKHLFMLSSGVLSPRFGEDSIIAQVRYAEEDSKAVFSSSAILSKLFNLAVAFGKECQSKYNMRTVDRVLIDSVKEKAAGYERILIVGSGEVARAVAEALKSDNHEVSMTLRDEEKIFLLPTAVKGLSYDKRREYAKDFDVIISASSGIYHTFEEEDRALLSHALLFDLSSPPDLPLSFDAIREENLIGKSKAKAELIAFIEEKALEKKAEYDLWLQAREGEELYREAEDLSYEVMRRLQNVLKDEKSLQQTIFETVRKAYITKAKSRRK